MRTVTLTNLVPELLCFNLPADVVPERSLSHRGSHQPRERAAPARLRPGDPPAKLLDQKRLAGSVTLTARGTPGCIVERLPPSVLRAPEVKAAIDEKKIKREIILTGDDGPKPITARVSPNGAKGGAP